MEFLLSIFLGVIQGVAEFLPISSSGHLVIIQHVINSTGNTALDLEHNSILLDVILHFGTLLSILVVLKNEVAALIVGFFRILKDLPSGKVSVVGDRAKKLAMLIIVATLPLFLGVVIQKQLEQIFTSTLLAGIGLLITGAYMIVCDKIAVGSKDIPKTTYKNALVVGLFQMIALTPGISRSGSTLLAGLLCGMKKEVAVKFSFLMAVPAILGAMMLQIPKAVAEVNGGNMQMIAAYLVGGAVSFVVGLFAIKGLLYFVKNSKMKYFAYYCWAVGVVGIGLSFVLK